MAAAAIKTKVYVLGGYDGTCRLNTVNCLDFSEDDPHWHTVAPMNQRRGLAGVCSYQGGCTDIREIKGQYKTLNLHLKVENANKQEFHKGTTVS